MSTPLVTFADPEVAFVDYLQDLFDQLDPDTVDVGVTLPADWQNDHRPFVQVAHDGSTSVTYPVVSLATVRITVFASTSSVAKQTANVAQAFALSHPGSADIANVRPGIGVVPTTDLDSGADMAFFTVLANMLPSVFAV